VSGPRVCQKLKTFALMSPISCTICLLRSQFVRRPLLLPELPFTPELLFASALGLGEAALWLVEETSASCAGLGLESGFGLGLGK
jgi:hypothetical protein